MTSVEFLFATLALLLTPGPTNTLLALAAARLGAWRAAPLMLAELTAYLLVVTPLAFYGSAVLAQWPGIGLAVRVAAGLWVLALAVRLWFGAKGNADGAGATVGWRQVFVTTLLNPKALVFGLVLLPQDSPGAALPRLVLLGGAILVAATVWIVAGRVAMAGAGSGRAACVQRGAACLLAALACVLLGGALRA